MAFTFLHCADLHLGSPFLGLAARSEAVAAQFASASREALSDLVSAAIEARVAFVLIAGDVYDGEWKDTSIGLFFTREMSRLHREQIPVFLIRGNHDAASEVTKSITLPAGVREFSAKRAETIPLPQFGVALHGRSFPEREVRDDFALTYPKKVDGAFNIGLLHTSCAGHPGHANYAPCTPAQLGDYGYDYWALGHVHDYAELSRAPWIVYPGNLQGRSVRECGPKGAVFVDVEDGRVAAVRHVAFDRARWALVDVDLALVDSEAEALRAVELALQPHVSAAEGRPLAVRVALSGATSLHGLITADAHRWRDEVEAAGQRLHEDVWLEKLKIDTRPPAARAAKGPADFDLAPILGDLATDAELRQAILSELGQMSASRQRFEEGDIGPLIEEARALLLARSAPEGC